METFQIFLKNSAEIVSSVLEFTSVVCIVIGFAATLILLFKTKEEKYSPLFNRLRLKFGGWLVLALEFLLAADILSTIFAPSYENLIQVGAIAAIRTFLNYFLNKELHELPEMIKKNLENKKIEATS
jgi:uncharacterized membrane protein